MSSTSSSSSFSRTSSTADCYNKPTAAVSIYAEKNSHTLPIPIKQKSADCNINNCNNNIRPFSKSSTSDHEAIFSYKRNTLPAGSSYSSSSVKVSSPLRNSWINSNGRWSGNENSSSRESKNNSMSTDSRQQQSWPAIISDGTLTMMRRSGKKKKKRTSKANRLLTMRQKRRTFPPSADTLRQVNQTCSLKEQPSSTSITSFGIKLNKRQHQRRSLQDILAAFYRVKDEEHGSSSLTASSNSTTSTQKIRKALKRKGKQPIHERKRETISSVTAAEELPPLIVANKKRKEGTATTSSSSLRDDSISRKSLASTAPSTPLKFPTPPKRSPLAIFFNHHFHKGQLTTITTNREQLPRRKSSVVADIIHHVHQRWSNHPLPQEETPTNTTSISSLSLSSVLLPTINNATIPRAIESNYSPRKAYDRGVKIHALLFIFGFLLFPLWWLGIGYYLYKRGHPSTTDTDDSIEEADMAAIHDLCTVEDLTSVRTFAYLNGIFSCISLVVLAFIISMIIWMVKLS